MYQIFPMNMYLNLITLILILWTIPWKIYAVWTAVKNDQRKWLVAVLILNTFSILEIYYIFKVANKNWHEVRADFRDAWASLKNK